MMIFSRTMQHSVALFKETLDLYLPVKISSPMPLHMRTMKEAIFRDCRAALCRSWAQMRQSTTPRAGLMRC